MPVSLPNESTIFRVCSYLRNWFDRNQPHYSGTVTITNGALSETYGLKAGQYFCIVGSSINDGVYKYPVTTLNDETFNGSIIGMAIPPPVLDIMGKIEEWESKYRSYDTRDGRAAMSPYSSESFGGYSYSKSNGGAGDSTKDKSGTWQGVFGAELQPWRKM